MPGRGWALGAVVCASLAAACTRLPEPESAGAQLYAARCGTCHRLYAPSTLKLTMWKYQVDRMQGEMNRRGIPPLTPDEVATLIEYLTRHAG